MPAFNAKPPIGLYPGDAVTLVNNNEQGITWTQAVAVATQGVPTSFNIQNTTNQTANVMVAIQDNPSSTNNYKQLTTDDGLAVTAAPGVTQMFTTQGPFVACFFPGAPTSGSLVIGR